MAIEISLTAIVRDFAVGGVKSLAFFPGCPQFQLVRLPLLFLLPRLYTPLFSQHGVAGGLLGVVVVEVGAET